MDPGNWATDLAGGSIGTNPEMLYIAIGIIGATVMPHHLYLRSSIVQTRPDRGAKREAVVRDFG